MKKLLLILFLLAGCASVPASAGPEFIYANGDVRIEVYTEPCTDKNIQAMLVMGGVPPEDIQKFTKASVFEKDKKVADGCAFNHKDGHFFIDEGGQYGDLPESYRLKQI